MCLARVYKKVLENNSFSLFNGGVMKKVARCIVYVVNSSV
ncbi:hypothetical protein UF75_3883 [Desulfosporosinus sp. I2]|nr:hypothetical protein UF75_3883 [Desulfosporosinus sp. I2]